MSDLEHWLAAKRLSVQCVLTNRWDRQDLHGAVKAVRPFARARKRLKDLSPTGGEAMNDLFWLLLKANPTLVPASEVAPTHLLNRMVAAEAMGLAALRRLRRESVGDPMLAALACVELELALRAIFDRLEVEQLLARELAELVTVVRERMDEVEAAEEVLDGLLDGDPAPEDLAAAHEAAERLRKAREDLGASERRAVEAEQELEDRLEAAGAVAGFALQSAMSDTADAMGQASEAGRAWGIAPGELRRLPAAERLALAARLNTEQMAGIADLFGRMDQMVFTSPATDTADGVEQVSDVEAGDDLGRLLPAELLLLGEPDAELAFLAAYLDRELLQYEATGDGDLGRGGIVFCCDSSGTMQGDRERWSKAVMLVLLHRARLQGRSMDVIYFSSPGQYQHFGFVDPEDFTPGRIIEAAEFFLGGGTDFKTPMEVALGLLTTEFNATGKTTQDVVFVTDDECWVHPEFMARYLAEMDRLQARTWGVYVAGREAPQKGPLWDMSEGRVMSVWDLQSGEDIRALLTAR